MAEGAPLLRVYRLIPYRGFESLALRHKQKGPLQGPFLFMVKNEDLVLSLRFDKLAATGEFETRRAAPKPAKRVRTAQRLF